MKRLHSRLQWILQIKYYILGVVLGGILIGYSHYSFALEVKLPSEGGQTDLNSKYTTVGGADSAVMKLIQSVNDYLWFFIGLVAFILLLYAGFKIITAQGDKEDIKKSYDLLIGAIVTIFVSLLSYTLVRLIVNLF